MVKEIEEKMWRSVKNPLFLLLLCIYTLVHMVRGQDFQLPAWINNHITDLICMPVILSLCLAGVRWIKRVPEFNLNLTMIFGMTAFYAWYFEFYLPQHSSQYTADLWDVLMYFTGAIAFWLFYQPRYAALK